MTTLASKPIRRKVQVSGLPHGIRSHLIITLYPGGVLGFRETGRRREYQIAGGALYAQLMAQEARRKP